METRESKASDFFPREWGLSQQPEQVAFQHLLFPTRVGVILLALMIYKDWKTFSHASGGYPRKSCDHASVLYFFPREWGLSFVEALKNGENALFPTRVGVIPSGGLSSKGSGYFFPREWGLSFTSSSKSSPCFLFPTRVGVIPYCNMDQTLLNPFSHASGGYPPLLPSLCTQSSFFPREWGLSL